MDINPYLLATRRYEKLRKLNPKQFSDLWERNLRGEGNFDDLVDKLPPAESSIETK